MIKKILLLFIFWLFSVWITFWYSCTNDNFPSSLWGDYCYNIWDYEYNSTIKDNNFNFYNVNLDWKLFTYNTYWIVWWENDWLHLTKQNYNSSNKINWTIDWFFICENYLPSTNVNLSDDTNCIYHSWFNDFWQYIGFQNKYFFGRVTSSSDFILRLCLYTDNYNSTFVCVEYNNYNWNNHSKFTQLWTTFLTTSTVMETAVNNPFISSGGGWDSGSVWSGLIVTPTCNKLKALNWYETKGYSDKLCYGWIDNYNIWDWNPVWTLPIYWSWKDVLDIWAETANVYESWSTWSTMWYTDWFWYWRWLYDLHKRWVYNVNPFVNTPLVLFTYFGAVDVYWHDYSNSNIIEYCDLKLYTSDYSVPYTWINNNKVCSLVDIIRDGIIWGGGSVWSGWIDWDNGVIWINPIWIIGSWSTWTWSWTWSIGSGDSEMTGYVDWRNFIIDFFGSLQDNFWDIANNNFWQWILPIYITIALMWLVLFRFLSH